MTIIDVSLFSLPDTHGRNQFMMLGKRRSDLDAVTSLLSAPCAAILRIFASPEEIVAALEPLLFQQPRLKRYAEVLRSAGSASFELVEAQASLIGMTAANVSHSKPLRLEPERYTDESDEDTKRRADLSHRPRRSVAA